MILTLPMECSNTKDDIHECLDKVQHPALGIQYITIHHTHWRYLTSIYLCKNRKKERKSVVQRFISVISCCSGNLQALVLFLVTCKRWRPAVPGFCTHRLLYCSSISSRNWYLAHALALQVGSNIIGFAIAAGMFVCDGTHSTYNYFILF